MMSLSKPQMLIYEEEKTIGGSIANISGSILFDGDGDKNKIVAAIKRMCKLNTVLRTRISEENGKPEQYISDELPQINMLTFVDENEFEEFCKHQAGIPVGIADSLCEFTGVLMNGKYGIFVRLNHIIGDAWTLALIGKQFIALYKNIDAELTIGSYSDYIVTEQKYCESKRYEKDKAYWSEKLESCDEVTLLSEKQVSSYLSARCTVCLNSDRVKQIKEYCKDYQTSPFVLFTTALGCYINRTHGNVQDFFVGTAVINRSTIEERNIMGMFVNSVPLLLHIDETKTFSQAMESVEQECMGVFRHEKFNYSDILSLLRKKAKGSGQLYDVIISYQNATVTALSAKTRWYPCGEQSESLEIHIDDRDETGNLTINYDYQTEKFSKKEVMALHEHLFNLIFDEIDNNLISEDDYSVMCCAEEEKEVSDKVDITIGKPIANTQIYILDKHLQPVPIGVSGELCIAGDCVGAGYLNRPELTAEKFIDNPFGKGKMYKTGDLARWREDGNIEYIGRNDFQVKIRGLRIELGEIENAISAFDGITQAVVAADKDNNGHQYLAGYYTASSVIDEKALRKSLAARLPKYMVPHYLVRLESIPMTTSGKVNRRNLPKPDLSSIHSQDYISPSTETEKQLCNMFEDMLNIEKVSVNDDFFDLGGDSLLSISLIAQIEQAFDRHISTKEVFIASTVKELAVLIDSIESSSEKILPTSANEYPVTPQQMGVYSSYAADEKSLAYNMPVKVVLPETVDLNKVKSAILKIFDKHKSLHTYFIAKDGYVFGVCDDNCSLEFEQNIQESEFVRPFNLAKAPLFRVCFNGRTMLIDTHHIISDGTTIHNMLKEMDLLYESNEIASSEITYGDYAAHIKGKIKEKKYEDALGFYRSMLTNDFVPVELPSSTNARDDCGKSYHFDIDNGLFVKCREYAKKNGLTDTALFLSVYCLLLSRYSSSETVLTSITLTNREYAQCRNVAGMFVNTVPIMLGIDERQSFKTYSTKVNSLLLNIYKYQELPFVTIADELGISNKRAMNTSFVYQAQGEIFFDFAGKRVVPQFIETGTAKFDLTVEIIPTASGASGRIEFNSSKYDARLIERLAESYLYMLSQIVE